MKTKTADLTGPALDWAVAKCEGHEMEGYFGPFEGGWSLSDYPFSTDWAQGGPIIDREKIGVTFNPHWEVPNWGAWSNLTDDRQEVMGETALIAAMRCYVASKLGDEVDVPEELT